MVCIFSIPMCLEISATAGLGSGERLMEHFHTPILHWISFNLRFTYLHKQLESKQLSKLTTTVTRATKTKQRQVTTTRNCHTDDINNNKLSDIPQTSVKLVLCKQEKKNNINNNNHNNIIKATTLKQ